MSRFDPHPDKPYGVCQNCGETLPTSDDMSAHLRATFENGRSHRASVTNQSRIERIESALQQLADDKLSDFADEAWDLVDRHGVTEDEITEAVRHVMGDFADAWEDSK